MRKSWPIAALAGFAVSTAMIFPPCPVQAQTTEDLPVRIEARPGPYLVGQGVDLAVSVAARDQRPKLELPALKDARLWTVETSFKPLSVSAIGQSLSGENAFVTRLRLVAQSPGVLEVPPITARLDDREGRSRPLRLKFENPPIEGRPSGFLGGVGDFSAQAEADQGQVRVGQEFLYRIRIAGPAAWGMTLRPDLARLRALPINPRIDDLADETVDEPPGRTFVYRVRPMKPGDVVLPPVSIASFDARAGRYMTRVAPSVPLKVVAVPAFEAANLDYAEPGPSRPRTVLTALAVLTTGGASLIGAVVAGRRLRRRWLGSPRTGLGPARTFARETAVRLSSSDGTDLAQVVIDALVEYGRLSVDRPPGALTPDEARGAVSRGTGSERLGQCAARITARCDRMLFAEDGEPDDAASLRRDAQELFSALGRSDGWLGGLRLRLRRDRSATQAVSGSRDEKNEWPRY